MTVLKPAIENTEQDWLDEDGYPTEEAIKRIAEWDYKEGWLPFMQFIRDLWAYADWGWEQERKADDIHEYPGTEFRISTAGWSGNESLIGAMQQNRMFWAFNWVQSRRGGHFIFFVRD